MKGKMKRIFINSVILVLLLIFAGCSWEKNSSLMAVIPEGAPVQKIQLVGQNCVWSPDVIDIQKGTHVILELESLDIPYNCDLKDYNLQFKVPAGDKVTAEFYASEPDTLKFGCNIEKNFHYQWGGVSGKLTAS